MKTTYRNIGYTYACALVAQNNDVEFRFEGVGAWYKFYRDTPVTVDQLMSASFREVIRSAPEVSESIAYLGMSRKSPRRVFHTRPKDPQNGISVYIKGETFSSCSAVKITITEIMDGD